MPPNSHNYCILTSKQFYTVQKAPEISSSEIFMNYAPPLKENSGSIKNDVHGPKFATKYAN